MKRLILIAVITTTAFAEDSYFSATSENLTTGDVVYTDGYTEHPVAPYQPQIEFLQRDTARLRAEIQSMDARDAADQQLMELQEQTRLLRKIAEKE
jgi:hypothetical protein